MPVVTETPVPPATGEIPTRTLVLGMAQADGTIQADEVYPVAQACGLTAEQVRSCLRRLVAEGLYHRAGEGRDARFTATEAGMRALQGTLTRLRRAYEQDAAGRGWDRRWHLAAFAVPERKRARGMPSATCSSTSVAHPSRTGSTSRRTPGSPR